MMRLHRLGGMKRLGKGGGGAVFTPASIPNLFTNHDAQALVGLNNGDAVSTFTDSSGNSRDATAAGAARPTYRTSGINGLPALQYSGGQRMATADIFDATFNTAFTIAEVVYSTDGALRLSTSIAGDKWYSGPNIAGRHQQCSLSALTQTTITTGVSGGLRPQRPANNQYQIICITSYDGSKIRQLINGVYSENAATGNLGLTGHLSLGGMTDGNFLMSGYIGQVLTYKTGATRTQMESLYTYLETRWNPTFNLLKMIVSDGDSISATTKVTLAQSWPYLMQTSLGITNASVQHMGIANKKLSDLITDAPNKINCLALSNQTEKILVIFAGTNDIGSGATGAQAYARLVTYCQNARTAGFSKIVAVTMLPRTDADYEAHRQTYNNAIRANAEGLFTAVADVETDADIGAAGASDNLTYYAADKLHPNAAGHVKLEAVIRPVVAGLL